MYNQKPHIQEQATPIPFEDRRIFMRFSIALPVKYFCSESALSGKGQVRDISADGMGILTNKRVNVYSHVDINVSIPGDNAPFYTTGEVVWIERVDFDMYRIGVKLDKPELMGVWRVLNGKSASKPEAHRTQVNESNEAGVAGAVKFIRRLLRLAT